MTNPASTPDHPLRRPPGRYDEPRALPRGVCIALAAVLGVALVTAAFLAYQRASGGVSYELGGYHVVDDRTVVVRFTVSGDLAAVTCRLQALDRDGVQVGAADVPAASGTAGYRLPTVRRAATAIVVGCGKAP